MTLKLKKHPQYKGIYFDVIFFKMAPKLSSLYTYNLAIQSELAIDLNPIQDNF